MSIITNLVQCRVKFGFCFWKYCWRDDPRKKILLVNGDWNITFLVCFKWELSQVNLFFFFCS